MFYLVHYIISLALFLNAFGLSAYLRGFCLIFRPPIFSTIREESRLCISRSCHDYSNTKLFQPKILLLLTWIFEDYKYTSTYIPLRIQTYFFSNDFQWVDINALGSYELNNSMLLRKLLVLKVLKEKILKVPAVFYDRPYFDVVPVVVICHLKHLHHQRELYIMTIICIQKVCNVVKKFCERSVRFNYKYVVVLVDACLVFF